MREKLDGKIRGWLRRPKSPQPSSAGSAQIPRSNSPQPSSIATAGPSQVSAPSTPSQRFLEAALIELPHQQRRLLEAHVLKGTRNVSLAVEQAYDQISKHRDDCENKKWHWSLNGKEIVLRDVADKVLRWLDRFKSIGDIIANADPVHAGLPWAGIRFLLEIAMLDQRQVAALLTGMSLALRMTNRLEAYFEYYQRLPTKTVTEIFKKGLVETFAHTLGFIAIAIEAGQKSTGVRMWNAVWETPVLVNFEIECDKLGNRLDVEANNCDRELAAQDRDYDMQWKRDMVDKLHDIRKIEETLDALHVKFDLSKLEVAAGAIYDSYDDAELAYCLTGTRTDLIQQIISWAADPDGKAIFWLCGMAGTGKSTLSRTVARDLDSNGQLAASFFFKRGEGDRGNARLFFPTLVQQLLRKEPSPAKLVAQALEDDPRLCDKALRGQFEKLLEGPLRAVLPDQGSCRSLFVVVDALDECERKEDVQLLLSLLTQIGTFSSLRLRIFVTSRPELPVEAGFASIHGDLHEDVILEEVQASTIEHDIRVYFKQKFIDIKSTRLREHPLNPLPEDWPSEVDMQSLVDLAVPLFIFASTVSRHLLARNPQKRLSKILDQKKYDQSSDFAKLYLPILEELAADEDEASQKELMDEFRAIVGPIVLLADPLSVNSLSKLLELDQEDISDTLKHLRSVLNVPQDPHQSVRLLHLSFRDFLVDAARKDRDRFWIDEIRTQSKLATQCLRLLDKENVLHRDMCGLRQPGTRRADVDEKLVATCIPQDVAYASLYWIHHTIQSKQELRDDGHVHAFLKRHLLHWLESLSWLGRLARAVELIDDLRSQAQSARAAEVAKLLEDARRFLLQNLRMIDLAPLQIYYSALEFAPIKSIIRRLFAPNTDQRIEPSPELPSDWGTQILKLEGHESMVYGVAFSPDGQVVASASDDDTLRLWSTRTGEERQRFNVSKPLDDVKFTKHDRILGRTTNWIGEPVVQLWNVQTGKPVEFHTPYKDHEGLAVISPNKIFVAATFGSTIHMFDTMPCQLTHTLEKCLSTVTALKFSLDSCALGSGSANGTIILWDVKDGMQLHHMGGHKDRIHDIVFLPPDKAIMISISADGTLRTWNTSTGEQRQVLQEFVFSYEAATLSPHGDLVAFASQNNAVRLWDISTGKETYKIEDCECREHDKYPVIAFSPNEQVAAIARHDRTIQLLNTQTGEQKQTLKGHTEQIFAITFSPDCLTVASASLDWSLRLWDASTGQERQQLDASIPIDSNTFYPSHKSILMSADGKLVALALSGYLTRIWNVVTGKCMRDIEGDLVYIGKEHVLSDVNCVITISDTRLISWKTQAEELKFDGDSLMERVEAITTSPDGQLGAVGTSRGAITLWDLESGYPVRKLQGCSQKIAEHRTIQHKDQAIGNLVFSPNGQLLASASSDGGVKLWDSRTGVLVLERESQKNHSYCDDFPVAISPSGHILALASCDEVVQFWCTQSGKILLQIKVRNGIISGLAFQPNASVIAVSVEATVQLWNTETGELLQMLQGHQDPVTAMVFSSDGKLLASASQDNTVRLWDAQIQKKMQEVDNPNAEVGALSISPNGKIVASVSYKSILLWNARSGKKMRRLQRYNDLVSRLAFSLDNSTLALASQRGPIMLCNIQTGKRSKVLKGHESSVADMSFTLDGTMLASASFHEQKVRIWDVQTGLQVREIECFWTMHDRARINGIQYVKALAWSRSGQYLALACGSFLLDEYEFLSLWNVKTGGNVWKLATRISNDSQGSEPESVSFSSDDQFVILALYDAFELYEAKTGTMLRKLRWPFDTQMLQICGCERQAHPLTISRDGKRVHSCAGTVLLDWTSSGKLVEPLQRTTGLELVGRWIRYQGHDLIYLPHDHQGICFTINENMLAIGRVSGTVDFYRVKPVDSNLGSSREAAVDSSEEYPDEVAEESSEEPPEELSEDHSEESSEEAPEELSRESSEVSPKESLTDRLVESSDHLYEQSSERYSDNLPEDSIEGSPAKCPGPPTEELSQDS